MLLLGIEDQFHRQGMPPHRHQCGQVSQSCLPEVYDLGVMVGQWWVLPSTAHGICPTRSSTLSVAMAAAPQVKSLARSNPRARRSRRSPGDDATR